MPPDTRKACSKVKAAHCREVPQDPVVFALTDRTSYLAGLLAAAVLYAATF
jgi:hypothetical protein